MQFWKSAEKNCQKAEKILLGAQFREETQRVFQEKIYQSKSSSGDVECSFEDHIEKFPPVVWNFFPQYPKNTWKLHFLEKKNPLKSCSGP